MQSAKKTFRHEYKQEDILEDKRNTIKYKAFQASIGAKKMPPDLPATFFYLCLCSEGCAVGYYCPNLIPVLVLVHRYLFIIKKEALQVI